MSSAPKEITDFFRQWLGSHEAQEYVQRCAYRILNDPESMGLHDIELIAGFHDENGCSGASELAHELIAFILETCLPEAASRPHELNLIFQGQFQNYLSRAVTRFLNHMKDRMRRRDADPVKYLYRRYRETLSSSDEFETGSIDGGGMWYAWIDNQTPIRKSATAYPPPSYSVWEFPEYLFCGHKNIEKRLFSAAVLTEIARFFHKAATEHGLPRELPIRELVNYTAERFPWLNRPAMLHITHATEAEHSPQDELDISRHEFPDQQDSTPSELADLAMSVHSMAVMAMEFAGRCSSVECSVLLMKVQDPPVKQKEIAMRLGLKDENQVNTIFSRVKRRLTSFVSSWPGPPLDELPKRARDIFMEELARCCKKRSA